MTEKQFLKNFKEHCEMARKLGIYSKRKMIQELNKERCPFDCSACMLNPKGFECFDDRCQQLIKLKLYQKNADYYFNFHPTEKMLTILKSIPWRKK